MSLFLALLGIVAVIAVAMMVASFHKFINKDEEGKLRQAEEFLGIVSNIVSAKSSVWVVPHKSEEDKTLKWAVKEDRDGKALSLHKTQLEAETVARDFAKLNGRELFIVGRNSEVRKKRTYNAK